MRTEPADADMDRQDEINQNRDEFLAGTWNEPCPQCGGPVDDLGFCRECDEIVRAI